MKRLYGTVREIVDVLGREKTLFLIGQLPKCYAGPDGKKSWRVILYVPQKLTPHHQLVRILGWHDAEKMVRAFPGEILQPANCAEIYREFRDISICRLSVQGLTPAGIARMFDVSERHVKNVLATVCGKPT